MKLKTEFEMDLLARRAAVTPRGIPMITDAVIESGAGAMLLDQEGREFIDFAGGIGVMNVGHCQPVGRRSDSTSRPRSCCTHAFTSRPTNRMSRSAKSWSSCCRTATGNEGDAGQFRRRSGRERHQDRSSGHQPIGHHLLHRGLSRSHDDGHVVDVEVRLQDGLRSVCSGSLPACRFRITIATAMG